MFFGGGGAIVDEGIATFDVGATAWLSERWRLGGWGTFPTVVGQGGTGGLLFAPAIRYQRRLRYDRSLHLATGPGYADSVGPVSGRSGGFIPYADIMYGIQAAGIGSSVPGRSASHRRRAAARGRRRLHN